MFFLVSILGIDKNYSKLIINLVVIFINYILSKFWIFKKS
jgi:putative flippase GtrA